MDQMLYAGAHAGAIFSSHVDDGGTAVGVAHGRLPFQLAARNERRTLPRPHARSREHRCTRPTQAIMAGSAKVDGNARAPRRGHTHDACAGSERRRPEVRTRVDLCLVHRPYRPPGDDSEAIPALSACQGVPGLISHHCHIATATGEAATMRTRCRQRAHDVVVKSVGRAATALHATYLEPAPRPASGA